MNHSIWKEALDKLDDVCLDTKDIKRIAFKEQRRQKRVLLCSLLLVIVLVVISVITWNNRLFGSDPEQSSKLTVEEGYRLIHYTVPDEYTVGNLFLLTYQDNDYIIRLRNKMSAMDISGGDKADIIWMFSLDNSDNLPIKRKIAAVVSDKQSIRQICFFESQDSRTESPYLLFSDDKQKDCLIRMLESLSSLTSKDNPAILAEEKGRCYVIIGRNAYTVDSFSYYPETIPTFSIDDDCKVIQIF